MKQENTEYARGSSFFYPASARSTKSFQRQKPAM